MGTTWQSVNSLRKNICCFVILILIGSHCGPLLNGCYTKIKFVTFLVLKGFITKTSFFKMLAAL